MTSEAKDRYPTDEFEMVTVRHVQLLKENCDWANETYRLVERYLYVQPLTVTNHQRNKNKRFIGEFALLLSGFDFYEVRELSSEMSQVWQNEGHITAVVDGMTKIKDRIQETLGEIDDYIIKLKEDLDLLQ